MLGLAATLGALEEPEALDPGDGRDALGTCWTTGEDTTLLCPVPGAGADVGSGAGAGVGAGAGASGSSKPGGRIEVGPAKTSVELVAINRPERIANFFTVGAAL